MPGFTLSEGNTLTRPVMHVQRSAVDGLLVVRLEGRFEFASRNEYKRLITEILQEDHRRMVIDLEQVTFLDSSALGLLLLTDQNFKLKKGHFGLVKPTGHVHQILEVANIPRVIPIFNTVEE